MRWCVPALIFCFSAQAGEYAVLVNGFRLHVDGHEQSGGVIALISGPGRIELPASSIAGFEADAPPPPPAPPPPAPAAALTPPDPRALVAAAARYAELPEALVASVAQAESAFVPNAVSRKGALGVMQLMPATAATLQADPHDVAQNVYAGALYLRELLIQYDGDVARALAAYNAGPGALEKYHGIPPFAETHAYVNRVIRDYIRRSRTSSSTSP